MKLAFIIKPCPWCKRTPKISLPLEREGTWNCSIRCEFTPCLVKPSTKIIGIRNTSKKLFGRFLRKLSLAISHWNTGNPMVAHETTIVDLSQIENKFVDFTKYVADGRWLSDKPTDSYPDIEIHSLLERTEPVYYDK